MRRPTSPQTDLDPTSVPWYSARSHLPLPRWPLSDEKGNVVKTARFLCGLVAVSCVLASAPALAQRMQFATPVDSTSGATPPGSAATAPPPLPYAAPPAPPVYATPSLSPSAPAASPTFAAPGPASGMPAAGAPGSIYAPAPIPSSVPAAPSAVVTQPPASNWDPYATPGNTPSALLQQDPCFQSSPAISMGWVVAGSTRLEVLA